MSVDTMPRILDGNGGDADGYIRDGIDAAERYAGAHAQPDSAAGDVWRGYALRYVASGAIAAATDVRALPGRYPIGGIPRVEAVRHPRPDGPGFARGVGGLIMRIGFDQPM